MTTRQQKLNQTLFRTSPYQAKQSTHLQFESRPVMEKNLLIDTHRSTLATSTSASDVSITSLIYFYRRVLSALFMLLSLLTIAPTCCVVVLAALSYMSCGHPAFVAIVTLLVTMFVRSQIVRYAPTKKQAVRALRASKIILPLLCVIASALICRLCVYVGVMNRKIGTSSKNLWSACQTGFYLGTLGLFLNLLVLFRFVGPLAVVKCSNGPLQLNPSDSFINTITNLSIVDAIQSVLETITSPSKDTAIPKQNNANQGYFKKPVTFIVILQIGFHAALGFSFGAIAFSQGKMISITTAFTCVMNFIANVLANCNHEIDTTKYPSLYGGEFLYYVFLKIKDETIKSMKSHNMAYQITAPVLCSLFFQEGDFISTVKTLLTAIGISFSINFFLYISDTTIRLFLSQKIEKTNALFPELSNVTTDLSKNTLMTQFLTRTILQSSEIGKEIISYTPPTSSAAAFVNATNAYSILQENHFVHTNQLAGKISRFFKSAPNLHLAEEILRINTLANLSLPHYAYGTSQEELMFHFSCIMKTLCVYVGGFGLAISLPVVPSDYNKRNYHESKLSKEEDPVETWLSPSAILEIEYAVQSILRLLSGSSKLTKNSYYFSHLHLLIPSMLSSLHLLHKGIHHYCSSQMKIEMGTGNFAMGVGTGVHGKEANLNRFIAVRHPNLKRIIAACEDTTKLVTSGERVEEEWRQSRLLNNECKVWLNSILE